MKWANFKPAPALKNQVLKIVMTHKQHPDTKIMLIWPLILLQTSNFCIYQHNQSNNYKYITARHLERTSHLKKQNVPSRVLFGFS